MLVKHTRIGKLLTAFFPTVFCKSVISAALNSFMLMNSRVRIQGQRNLSTEDKMRRGDNNRQTDERYLQASGCVRGKNLNLSSVLCRYILVSSQNETFL